MTSERAEAIARAPFTVASTAGTTPLSAADRRAIVSALPTVFGHADPIAVDSLAPIASIDLAEVVEDPATRLDLVRVLAVIALLDGAVEQAKLELVLDVASALHVHAEFVDGNVYLGLDAEKLWVAWTRGRAMTEDVYSGHWSFWDHQKTPLEELRQRWGIPPLDPSMAALADDQIERAAFVRACLPEPPPVSSVAIANRPPAAAG